MIDIQEIPGLADLLLRISQSTENLSILRIQELLDECARMTSLINDEVDRLYAVITSHYGPHFPELRDTVRSPSAYFQVIKLLQTDDLSGLDLTSIPDKHLRLQLKIMTCKHGVHPLDSDIQAECVRLADACLATTLPLSQMIDWMKGQMRKAYPNLTAFLGEQVVAHLMSINQVTLQRLATMPAQNIKLLGGNLVNMASSSNIMSQAAWIHLTDFVQKVPDDFKGKAIRVVSNKTGLAARVDLTGEHLDGAEGAKLRAEVDEALTIAMTTPDIAKTKNPLPVPTETKGRRRGGKRYRHDKLKRQKTTLGKHLNRVQFGDPKGNPKPSEL